MKKIVMFIVVIMLTAVVTAAQAEVRAGSFSVTPFIGGYVFEGNEYDLKTTYTVGLRAGYNITQNLGMEGYFNYIPTEVKDAVDADVKIYGYGIEGLYHFMPEKRFVPFLALGFGGIRYNPSGHDEMNKYSVDYGAGLKFFLTDDIALRADVRHILPLNDQYNDLLVSFGINFAFGGKKVALAKVDETPAPVEVIVDSDKDGVPDNFDKCPNTPFGVSVDKDGCPLDSDHDGVPDYLDKCSDTPAGLAVDKDGCSLDSDKDGVPDTFDKCPNTPAGAVVDKDGCSSEQKQEAKVVVPEPLREKVSIALNVEFDTAKAVIKKKYHDEIKKVADFMKAHPETNAVIEGHTDNVDRHNDPSRNIKLSQARADSIRQYLIDKFEINASRITAVGYGPSKPIASNDTEEGRKKNRRVQAVIEAVKTK